MATRRSRLKVKPNILRAGGAGASGTGRSTATKSEDIPNSDNKDDLATKQEPGESKASGFDVNKTGSQSFTKDVPLSSPRKRRASSSDPHARSPRRRRTSENVELAPPGSPRKRTTSGNAELVPPGSPRKRTTSGNAELVPPGSPRKRTTSGNAELMPPGSPRKRTTSGNAELVPPGSLRKRTISGNAELVPPGSPRKRTTSGNAELAIPGSPRKRTTSGNVELVVTGSQRKRTTSGSMESKALPQVHSPRTRSVSKSENKSESPLSPKKHKSSTSENTNYVEPAKQGTISTAKQGTVSTSRRRSTKVVPNMTFSRPSLLRKTGKSVSDEVKNTNIGVSERLGNDQLQEICESKASDKSPGKNEKGSDAKQSEGDTNDKVIETIKDLENKNLEEEDRKRKPAIEKKENAEDVKKEHFEHAEEEKKEKPVDANSKPSVGLTRRRFNRAKPNIGDVGRSRVRHASMSGSEADGHIEINKPPPVPRVTVTETCSASEGGATPKPADTPGLLKLPVLAVSQEEMVTVAEKNPGRRASRIVDDEAPKRKRRKMEKLTTIDRTKLTMRDLIYMNPVNNPMKSSLEKPEMILKQKTDEGQISRRNSIVSQNEGDAEADTTSELAAECAPPKRNESVDTLGSDGEGEEEKSQKDEEKEEESLLVPQVKIDANGQIILNEASLLVDNPNNSVENEDMTLVHEHESNFSCSYGRKTNSKSWSLSETKKFYLALSAVGTDFSLMDKLFPHRTRTELKRKFKREDKVNRGLVDKAIAGDRQVFDLAFFEEVAAFDLKAAEEEENREKKERRKKVASSRRKRASIDDAKAKNNAEGSEEVEKKPSRGRKKKEQDSGKPNKPKKKRGRPKTDLYKDSESEDEPVLLEEDSHVGKEAEDEKASSRSSDDDEAETLEHLGDKPTKSGRQPKRSKKFNIEPVEPKKRQPKKSLVIPDQVEHPDATNPNSSQPDTPVSQGRVRRPSETIRTPGQFINISNLSNVPNVNVNNMQPGSLVFVTSNPSSGGKGGKVPGASPQFIHVYMVSPSGRLGSPDPQATVIGSMSPMGPMGSRIPSTNPQSLLKPIPGVNPLFKVQTSSPKVSTNTATGAGTSCSSNNMTPGTCDPSENNNRSFVDNLTGLSVETVQPLISDQPPIVDQPPVNDQPPIVDQPPVNDQPPIVVQPPVSDQPPIVDQSHDVDQPSIVDQPPVNDQPPIVVQPPVSDQPPIVDQSHDVDQPSIVDQPPVNDQLPILDQPPVNDQPSILDQSHDVDQPPVIDQPPIDDQPPSIDIGQSPTVVPENKHKDETSTKSKDDTSTLNVLSPAAGNITNAVSTGVPADTSTLNVLSPGAGNITNAVSTGVPADTSNVNVLSPAAGNINNTVSTGVPADTSTVNVLSPAAGNINNAVSTGVPADTSTVNVLSPAAGNINNAVSTGVPAEIVMPLLTSNAFEGSESPSVEQVHGNVEEVTIVVLEESDIDIDTADDSQMGLEEIPPIERVPGESVVTEVTTCPSEESGNVGEEENEYTKLVKILAKSNFDETGVDKKVSTEECSAKTDLDAISITSVVHEETPLACSSEIELKQNKVTDLSETSCSNTTVTKFSSGDEKSEDDEGPEDGHVLDNKSSDPSPSQMESPCDISDTEYNAMEPQDIILPSPGSASSQDSTVNLLDETTEDMSYLNSEVANASIVLIDEFGNSITTTAADLLGAQNSIESSSDEQHDNSCRMDNETEVSSCHVNEMDNETEVSSCHINEINNETEVSSCHINEAIDNNEGFQPPVYQKEMSSSDKTSTENNLSALSCQLSEIKEHKDLSQDSIEPETNCLKIDQRVENEHIKYSKGVTLGLDNQEGGSEVESVKGDIDLEVFQTNQYEELSRGHNVHIGDDSAQDIHSGKLGNISALSFTSNSNEVTDIKVNETDIKEDLLSSSHVSTTVSHPEYSLSDSSVGAMPDADSGPDIAVSSLCTNVDISRGQGTSAIGQSYLDLELTDASIVLVDEHGNTLTTTAAELMAAESGLESSYEEGDGNPQHVVISDEESFEPNNSGTEQTVHVSPGEHLVIEHCHIVEDPTLEEDSST